MKTPSTKKAPRFKDERDAWYTKGPFTIRLVSFASSKVIIYLDDVEILSGDLEELKPLNELLNSLS